LKASCIKLRLRGCRRAREARSGPPVDLVVAMEGGGGRFVHFGSYSDVLEEQELQQALRHLLERHQRGEAGLPVLPLLQAVGAVPARCQLRRRARCLAAFVARLIVTFALAPLSC
jgi:hypothetical protein